MMVINIETAVSWMASRAGRVTYSMIHRNGPSSYDCSSSVVSALISAGASNPGWLLNTEYMHDWLIKNGYKLISENQDWESKRGDIFIWGRRGQSSGAGGHTGMFVDANNIIHCNYGRNGITIDNYNQTAAASGWMYVYVYRLVGSSGSAPSTKSDQELAKEVLAGKYGDGNQRKAALGDRAEAVQRVVNELLKANQKQPVKTDEELAKEVLAGKHGNGNDRKKSLGPRYDAVQAKVDQIIKGASKDPEIGKKLVPEVVKQDGDLSLDGVILRKSVLDTILAKCKEHSILPSYAITVLHFEGLWGASTVGKADNNWGGMTWTGQGNRPSGVTVTQGTARPSNEGGHYMHYTSVEDFLTDWFYLLRSGGSYKVSGAKTFSEAVKGMFKPGGAVYDYAAVGYDDYLVGMSSRLKAIEKENGSLTKFDATSNNVNSVKPDKIDVVIDGIEISINGVAYTISKKPI